MMYHKMINSKLSLREFKDQFGRKELKLLAESIGSSVKYFDHYTSNPIRRRPSKAMCDKIIDAKPELFSLQSLRPDFYS